MRNSTTLISVTTKMALNNLCKLKLLIFLVIFKLGHAATNYLSDNSVGARETSHPTHYSEIPQEYYLSYRKHISPFDQKYAVSRPESQNQIAVTSTENPLLTPTYRVALEPTKYITSQAAKPVHGNQVSYPYTYTFAKVPPTAATYISSSNTVNDYTDYTTEVPKKYHFGYRVSNPHTGTEFGHSEVNDGLTARGYYHVLLPDGRLQNVKYWAGPSGYHATITYETQY